MKALRSIGLLILGMGGVQAAEPLPLARDYWKDPAFQKSFNGSYRIEARIEPTVTGEERALLIAVQKLMAKGQREEALAKLVASSLSAESAALNFNLGNLYFETGDDEKAIAAYSKAIEKYPSFRRAHRNLALALVRSNRMEEALDPLLTALQLGDASGMTYGLLGYCRLNRGEWASALQAYRLAQISEPEVLDWKAGVAQCLEQLDGKVEAVALLDEVIRQRPQVSAYALLQASILLDLDRAHEAIKVLDLPRRLGTLDGDGLLLLAELHLRAGQADLAKARLAEVLADEREPDAGRLISLVHLAMHGAEWELAESIIARAKKDGSEDVDPRLSRLEGQFLIRSGSDPAGGEELLRELLGKAPDDGETLLILGRHLASAKRKSEASMLLERATAVGESAPDAWLELARLRVDSRNYKAALEAVDETLALRPDTSLQEYRKSLAQLVEAAR